MTGVLAGSIQCVVVSGRTVPRCVTDDIKSSSETDHAGDCRPVLPLNPLEKFMQDFQSLRGNCLPFPQWNLVEDVVHASDALSPIGDILAGLNDGTVEPAWELDDHGEHSGGPLVVLPDNGQPRLL